MPTAAFEFTPTVFCLHQGSVDLARDWKPNLSQRYFASMDDLSLGYVELVRRRPRNLMCIVG